MIELIKFCPDIQGIVVPTNWVHTNISDLCQLLQVINDNITPRKENNLLHFHVQMSIDGTEGDIFIQDGHTASWK
ncbi:MAG: hypothetical protein E7167_01145 [Firmicutes bacterium]|nr:hypothetical protein [Bacillota bacterium]